MFFRIFQLNGPNWHSSPSETAVLKRLCDVKGTTIFSNICLTNYIKYLWSWTENPWPGDWRWWLCTDGQDLRRQKASDTDQQHWQVSLSHNPLLKITPSTSITIFFSMTHGASPSSFRKLLTSFIKRPILGVSPDPLTPLIAIRGLNDFLLPLPNWLP